MHKNIFATEIGKCCLSVVERFSLQPALADRRLGVVHHLRQVKIDVLKVWPWIQILLCYLLLAFLSYGKWTVFILSLYGQIHPFRHTQCYYVQHFFLSHFIYTQLTESVLKGNLGVQCRARGQFFIRSSRDGDHSEQALMTGRNQLNQTQMGGHLPRHVGVSAKK